jgi:hypothetical protein
MDLSRQHFLGVDLRISFLAFACSVSPLRPCLDIHIRTTLAIRGVSYRHKCIATRKKSHEFHRMTHHFSKRKNASHIIFADWKCAMVRGFGADLICQGANCLPEGYSDFTYCSEAEQINADRRFSAD